MLSQRGCCLITKAAMAYFHLNNGEMTSFTHLPHHSLEQKEVNGDPEWQIKMDIGMHEYDIQRGDRWNENESQAEARSPDISSSSMWISVIYVPRTYNTD